MKNPPRMPQDDLAPLMGAEAASNAPKWLQCAAVAGIFGDLNSVSHPERVALGGHAP